VSTAWPRFRLLPKRQMDALRTLRAACPAVIRPGAPIDGSRVVLPHVPVWPGPAIPMPEFKAVTLAALKRIWMIEAVEDRWVLTWKGLGYLEEADKQAAKKQAPRHGADSLSAMIGDGWTMTLQRSPGYGDEPEPEQIADAFRMAAQCLTKKATT
jgi:hypothetical protein